MSKFKKIIKPEERLMKFTAIEIIIGIVIIVAMTILLIAINKNICFNNDVLNKYDTYVIGRKVDHIYDSDAWIDDSGEIHKDEHYAYVYEYNYNGKIYSLTRSYEPDIYDIIHVNDYKEEPIKIKSESPEQAVIANEYGNNDEKFARFAVIFMAISLIIILIVIYVIEVLYDWAKYIKIWSIIRLNSYNERSFVTKRTVYYNDSIEQDLRKVEYSKFVHGEPVNNLVKVTDDNIIIEPGSILIITKATVNEEVNTKIIEDKEINDNSNYFMCYHPETHRIFNINSNNLKKAIDTEALNAMKNYDREYLHKEIIVNIYAGIWTFFIILMMIIYNLTIRRQNIWNMSTLCKCGFISIMFGLLVITICMIITFLDEKKRKAVRDKHLYN